MKSLITVICMVLLIVPSFLFAQSDGVSFGIFGGVALPQGDFGDDNEEDNGAALTGFCGGIDLTMPLNSPVLSFIGSATVLFNGFDEDVLLRMMEDSPLEPRSVDTGSWINIPIMGGIKYQSEMSQTNDFYILGQAGLNFVMPPKLEFVGEDGGEDNSGEIEIDSGTSFGFCFGGGMTFNKNISVGFRYYILGEPDLDGKVTVEGEVVEDDYPWEGSISIIALTVGINFN